MLLLLLFLICIASGERLLLTIAYCPSAFKAGGALVSVDLPSGTFKIEKTFKWPDDISSEGCGAGAFDSPAFVLNKPSSTLYLDFVDEFGLLVSLNLQSGETTSVAPSNAFFTGFWNMALADDNTIIGIYGNVTQGDWCSNGCFAVGTMDVNSGAFTPINNLPYKAVLDDTHLFDRSSQTLWFQASYPLTSAAMCSDTDSDLCLVAVTAQSAAIQQTKYSNWTVYQYANARDSKGNVNVWMEGFDELCNNPYDDFLFASVNLPHTTAKPIACIPKGVVDQEEPWLSSWSADDSLLATASGDGDSGEAQLLVFHTATGKVLVENKLPGLGQALRSFEGVFWIWHVTFLD